MSALLLDGRAAAKTEQLRLSAAVKSLSELGIEPTLHIFVFGDDEPTHLYAGRLEKAAGRVGIAALVRTAGADVTSGDVERLIDEVNADENIDGVIVGMPLPRQIPVVAVAARLSPKKDVDGITVANAGRLALGEPCHVPSTAAAILHLLNAYSIRIEGQRAVIVGRSPVVGKPTAALLLRENATVTVAHSRTVDLSGVIREADIVIAAAGAPNLIRGEMLKPGAVVVDAGINVHESGIVGDVNYEEAVDVAGAISPVPGGVGPLTNAMLLAQVVNSATARHVPEPTPIQEISVS
jgi:methylenetetrahydrofolate dehydrogenase (NADP+)/methenyltetrahydrofolate cyclohydrolase